MQNDFNVEQNEKDVKFYKFCITMAFVASLVIALIVGIVTCISPNVDKLSETAYTMNANVTNTTLSLFMPKSITDEQDGSPIQGYTFYREKNKEFNAKENLPLEAFNYYYFDKDGKRIDLVDGVYIGADDNDKHTSDNIPVYLGFYIKAAEKFNIVGNVIKVITAILILCLIAGFIYIWYRVWSKKEDERQALQAEYNKRINNKNKLQ